MRVWKKNLSFYTRTWYASSLHVVPFTRTHDGKIKPARRTNVPTRPRKKRSDKRSKTQTCPFLTSRLNAGSFSPDSHALAKKKKKPLDNKKQDEQTKRNFPLKTNQARF